MFKIVVLCALMLSQSGCLLYAQWKLTLAERDWVEEKAAIVKLYRECLQANPGPPGKAQCEHYTQALYSLNLQAKN